MAGGAHRAHLDESRIRVPEGHALRKAPLALFAVGLVGLIASLALAFGGQQRQFYFSWLVAFMFALSLALGGLFFVLIQHCVRAGWSVTLRRVAEQLMGTLPFMVLLFIPIAIGMPELYEHWMNEEHVAHDPLLQAKAPYLNVTFFSIRAVFVLAAFSLMGWWFLRTSLRQDATGDPELTRPMQKASAPCLFLFALTVTLAALDWLMSLQPHWYSTIFGGWYFAGCVIGIVATLIIVVTLLQVGGLMGDAVTVEHFHDLAKLLFAFVVFWGYVSFSQFMLIWYANIPEETAFFHARLEGSWRPVSIFMMFGHFLLPFFYLIPRTVKRTQPLLVAGAAWMLLVHYIDLYWVAMPVLHPEGFSPSLLDLTTLLAVMGLAGGWFVRSLSRSALVPVADPRLDEALAFENF